RPNPTWMSDRPSRDDFNGARRRRADANNNLRLYWGAGQKGCKCCAEEVLLHVYRLLRLLPAVLTRIFKRSCGGPGAIKTDSVAGFPAQVLPPSQRKAGGMPKSMDTAPVRRPVLREREFGADRSGPIPGHGCCSPSTRSSS